MRSQGTAAAIVTLITLILIAPHGHARTELNFSLLVINGEQRTAYLKQVQAFEKENPSIKVKIRGVPSAEYKANIENWLKAKQHSDVMFWFSGERLNWFVSQELVTPIDEVWANHKLEKRITPSARSAIEIGNIKYGLPIHYYHWGIYYNIDVFKRFRLEEPSSWKDFVHICETLKKHGIIPIAIGSKEIWPVASWFDYLNLRVNGLEYHKQLLGGKISYKDAGVKNVFAHFATLVNNNYFLEGHPKITWKDALPYLYRGLAGMYLMGNFWTSQIPESYDKKISLFKFPQVDSSMPFYEEAPTDILIIPKNVQHRKEAELFLEFMSRPEVQSHLNDAIGTLAPQISAHQETDKFLTLGRAILENAQGASQYYDRDSPQPIAIEGMKQMQHFMQKPHALPVILNELEALRKQSFNK